MSLRTRRGDSEAAKTLSDDVASEPEVTGFHEERGDVFLGVRVPPDDARVIARWVVGMLDSVSAENYTETKLSDPETPGEHVLLTCRRGTGKTPHDLRLEADAEVERLRAVLTQIQGLDTLEERNVGPDLAYAALRDGAVLRA